MADLDVVVAGGSIAGLAFAAEAAKRGLKVLVFEEHKEIGEPEKCDGLVSLRGLRRFGFAPHPDVIQNPIASGVIHAHGGRSLALNATALDIVVLDRSAYDKQVAGMAASWTAEIRTGVWVSDWNESGDGVSVKTTAGEYRAKYFVDATGPASSPKEGIIPAAKYEIEAPWVNTRIVEVFLDQDSYPGFFAWIIPFGHNLAKVGVAGRGIDTFDALDAFLANREHRVLKKVAAPIYVGGPALPFAKGRVVRVGESAGQVKPTTAGGITTSIAGAVIAARWVSDAIQLNNTSLVANYEPDWLARYGKEMKSMKRLRRFFEAMSNDDLDSITKAISTPRLTSQLSQSDFDFHASALLSAIGLSGVLKLTGVVAKAEAKSLLRRK
jgi:digeranylgeranylglycerophospholipid reductase